MDSQTISTQIDIERMRFAHYQPQGIEAMALSYDKQLLALGRENQSIEIWKVPHSWAQLSVIPGNKNCDIRRIHWLESNHASQVSKEQQNYPNPLYYQSQDKKFHKRRLITTGLNGLVIEWDLRTLKPKSKYACNSAIWDSKMHGKCIYLACEDGTVKILKVKKNKIEYIRQLFKAESSCLSIELIKENGFVSTNNEDGLCRNIFTGYSDSSIRKWDLSTGNSILHFQKQSAKKQKNTKSESCIWQLKLYKNFLISGDSQGHVCIWDSEYGTLLKQFTNLQGDINTIEVNAEYNSVYASGIDSRVLTIQLKESQNGLQEWVFASLFRGQSHDIKALALLNPNKLLSAGVTTDICVYNLQSGRMNDQFGKDSKQQNMSTKLRHIPPFPYQSTSIIGDELVCVLDGNNRAINLYNIETQLEVLRLEKSGDYNIKAFDNQGQFIVYSDARDLQVFKFDQSTLNLTKLTKKICLQNNLNSLPSALYVKLFKDENQTQKLLILDQNLTVSLISLGEDLAMTEIMNLNDALENQLQQTKIRSYDKLINLASYNPSQNQLYVSFLNQALFLIFDLNKSQIFWNLPHLPNEIPLCLHSDQDKLLVAYDTNKIMILDLLNKRIHDWSAKYSQKLPQNFLTRYNRMIGIVQITNEKYILYTNYTYAILDLKCGVPEEVEIIQNHPGKSTEERGVNASSWFENLKISQSKYIKNKAQTIEQEQTKVVNSGVQNLTISNKIKGILAMKYDKDNGRLQVIENVWKKVVENFQGTLAIKKFGQ